MGVFIIKLSVDYIRFVCKMSENGDKFSQRPVSNQLLCATNSPKPKDVNHKMVLLEK